MKNLQRVLAVFIEPTPYVLGFLLELEKTWSGELDVIFLKENHTQDWNITLPVFCTTLSSPAIKTICCIRRQILKNKYSLIHLAGWGNPVCLYLFLFSKAMRIPLSVETDTQLHKNISNWKRAAKYWLYQRPFYPILFKLPSIFLPGGTRQANYLQHYGVAQAKIVVAQMTVDVKGLQEKYSDITLEEKLAFRRQYNVEQDEVVFLFVGRFLDWKGVRELILAFKSLNIPSVRLWLVGNGDLENYVKECAATDCTIHYFGRVEGETLIRIYHAADVFVLPSLAEPWGLVVNEAMAAGKAMIVSDTAGCVDDLIIQNKTGLLVPPQNIPALIDAMALLANSTDLRDKLQIQAKAHISSWSLENEAKNVVRAWELVL